VGKNFPGQVYDGFIFTEKDYSETLMKQQPVIIVQLVHIQGPFKGKIQEFSEDRISIGRHPSSLLQFPADLTVVSRNHAEIIREGNRFKLVDHSSNGTFVDGKRIQNAYLKDGVVLSFAEGGPKVSFLTQILENQPGKEGDSLAPQPPELTPPSPNSLYDDPKPSFNQEPVRFSQEPARFSQEPARFSQEPARFNQEPVRFSQEPVSQGSVSHAPFDQKSSIREPFSQRPDPAKPEPGVRVEVVVQSMRVPLIIQYGPTLRAFKEVPVTMGTAGDFQLDHPGIHCQHVQIFYNQDRYWVKDLTGQKLITINQRPINLQSPLNPGDELALSPQGPLFRFLGDGRLAEIQQPTGEHSISSAQEEGKEVQEGITGKKDTKNPLSILKKIWKH
jgi:pSer/pThr/pTyr-binding forkhead associated (FHA) protein